MVLTSDFFIGMKDEGDIELNNMPNYFRCIIMRAEMTTRVYQINIKIWIILAVAKSFMIIFIDRNPQKIFKTNKTDTYWVVLSDSFILL